MFHPVGSQPPSVYWRRRLMVLGSIALVIVLIALTVKTMRSGGDAAAGGGASTTPNTRIETSTSPVTRSSASTTTGSGPSSSTTAGGSSSTAPDPCAAKDLSIAAVVGKPSYQVGDQPLLELQVTNVGSRPCVQDLADKAVELRVYNGESRVWGSHDCQIQPGTDNKMLAVRRPVQVAVTWSGLTSQPKCAGTRQRVGAGTYTLYAVLSGKTGKAKQFTIS
ncbi:MAG: hypothetical protein QOC66_1619 [Pseudonocardiales bacterium]|jgi:hypothetical protein|nr:hypothetical protein [Pseudonocardiales bacterium]